MVPALTRRHVLLSGTTMIAAPALSSLALLPASAHAAPGDGFRILRARAVERRANGDAQPPATLWGYDGEGGVPLVRATRGEEVRLRLVNELPEPTALHWHGVRIANAMDGVPHLTQPPVAPRRELRLSLCRPGCRHFLVPPAAIRACSACDERVARPHPRSRLAGRGSSIDHPDRADVDHDVVAFIEQAPHPRRRSPLRINRAPVHDIAVRTNERLRLRLINAADRMLALRFDRHRATVMALDGQPAEPFVARDGRVSSDPAIASTSFVDATLEPGDGGSAACSDRRRHRPLVRARLCAGAPGRAAPRPVPRPCRPIRCPHGWILPAP